MKVKFLADYQGSLTKYKFCKAGSVAEVGVKEGAKLVNRNRAVEIKVKPPAKKKSK